MNDIRTNIIQQNLEEEQARVCVEIQHEIIKMSAYNAVNPDFHALVLQWRQ